MFTFKHDTNPKTSTTFLKFNSFSFSPTQNNIISSANYKWETKILSPPTLKPLIRSCLSALLTNRLNPSATKVKRKGDNGSPCLNPLDDSLIFLQHIHVKETDALSRMHKLRLLQLNNVRLVGSYEKFPKELRWLCWHGCPLNVIPSDFSLQNLVVLEIHNSNLQKVWEGTKVWLVLLFLS